MPITPSQIRAVELPRSLRGYEESATKKLIADAALALEQALADRDTADRLLRESREASPLSVVPPPAANEAEALGTALLTAQRLGERLVNEAREEAARITSEAESQARERVEKAEAQARDVLGRAELESRSKVGEIAGHVEALRRSEKELAAALDGRRQMVVRYIQQVGAQLSELSRVAGVPASPDGRGTTTPPAALDRTLHTRIETAVPPQDRP